MALRNISSTSREMSSAASALSADDMPSSEPTPWIGETLLVTSLPTTLGAAASGMLLTSASDTWTASRPLFPAWARTVSLSSIWLPGNKKKIFKVSISPAKTGDTLWAALLSMWGFIWRCVNNNSVFYYDYNYYYIPDIVPDTSVQEVCFEYRYSDSRVTCQLENTDVVKKAFNPVPVFFNLPLFIVLIKKYLVKVLRWDLHSFAIASSMLTFIRFSRWCHLRIGCWRRSRQLIVR